MKVVYKIVDREMGSCGLSPWNSRRILYNIGTTAVSIDKPMFAFKTLEKALKFYECMNYLTYRILECDAVPSKKQHKYMCGNPQENEIDTFWKEVKYKKRINVNKGIIVDGTIFCERITPLSIIK